MKREARSQKAMLYQFVFHIGHHVSRRSPFDSALAMLRANGSEACPEPCRRGLRPNGDGVARQ
jgi:hypothetical protein